MAFIDFTSLDFKLFYLALGLFGFALIQISDTANANGAVFIRQAPVPVPGPVETRDHS